MVYDIHAHCIPVGLLDALRSDGGRYGITITDDGKVRRATIAGGTTTAPLRPVLEDVDARLRAMDAARVDTQLISNWIPLTAYALPPDAAARYTRLFNDALTATTQKAPDRLVGLCTVALQAPDNAAAELRRAVVDLGMAGVEIATTVNGRDLDAPELDPFWAAAEQLQCLVLLHPVEGLPGRDPLKYSLGNVVGYPAETTAAVAYIVLGGVFERFPDLRLCVVHGGGFVPFQRGRFERLYRARPEVVAPLRRSPLEWLRRIYYDTVTSDAAALRFLIDFVGPEQVLLGSDYPFESGDPDPLATLAAVDGLDEQARTLIVEGNVRRLLEGIRR